MGFPVRAATGQERMAKGTKSRDQLVAKACDDCYNTFFTDYLRLQEAKGGMPPKWGKVSFHCPVCGQICNDCVEEKKQFLGGSSYRCKNCGFVNFFRACLFLAERNILFNAFAEQKCLLRNNGSQPPYREEQ